MQVELKPIANRTEWLEWRKEDVTASVTGALPGFNCDPYHTPLWLYLAKKEPDLLHEEENAMMRRGRWLEPAVAKAVAEARPEWTLEEPKFYLRAPEHRIGATPDYLIHDARRGRGVLQCKTVLPSVYEREWIDGTEPPLWVVLQTSTELMLAAEAIGATFAAIAVLEVDAFRLGSELPPIHEFERRRDVEERILQATAAFWADVAANREPDPDFARDRKVIELLAGKPQSGKIMSFAGNNRIPEVLAERAALMAQLERLDGRKEEIETEIKFLMGDAEIAEGVDGYGITFKQGERKAYTVAAKTLRTLRITERQRKSA